MDHVRWQARSGLLAAAFSIASAAHTAPNDPDPRLLVLRVPAPQDRALSPIALPIAARALLPAGQAATVRGVRTRGGTASLGRIEVTARAERFKSPRPDVGEERAVLDRVSARALGLGLAVPIDAGLSVQSELLVSHVKRRPAGTPASAFARPIDSMLMSVGLAGEGGPAIMMGYGIDRRRRGHATPDRAADLLGGDGASGHGLRLEISSRSDDPPAGQIRWGLTLADMQRPRHDDPLAIGSSAGTFARDRRLALSARLAL